MDDRPPLIPEADVSTELVRRAKQGDHDAWDSLYLRYRDRLLLYTRCRLGPALRTRLQSEDILQSVFKDVVGDIDRFQPDGKESLNRYLHVCVLNKIRKKFDYFNAQKRAGDVPLTESVLEKSPDSTDQLDYWDSALYEKLELAIARLPEAMREVLFLRAFENQSNQEAAKVMDKTTEATSKLYNRALSRLGLMLSGIQDD